MNSAVVRPRVAINRAIFSVPRKAYSPACNLLCFTGVQTIKYRKAFLVAVLSTSSQAAKQAEHKTTQENRKQKAGTRDLGEIF